jgi:hypothetical protein
VSDELRAAAERRASEATPGVSLKAHGLRLREGLDCPEGGPHEVPDQPVIVAAAQGGGKVACLKCRQELHLDPLP